jgi:two-component system chemotaxis response regulator CheY
MNAPKKTVLVIEDDEDCRYVYGEFLRFAGFDSIEAANGEAALRALATSPKIALIVLDLTLPGMTPKQFIERLRTIEPYKTTPVLVLSGRHDIADQAKELGANGFVKKPCDLGPLTDAVLNLTETARL